METDCLFCQIAQGKRDTRFLLENDTLVAFRDIRPHAPVHILIVPKKHIRGINDLGPDDAAIVGQAILAARDLAEAEVRWTPWLGQLLLWSLGPWQSLRCNVKSERAMKRLILFACDQLRFIDDQGIRKISLFPFHRFCISIIGESKPHGLTVFKPDIRFLEQ